MTSLILEEDVVMGSFVITELMRTRCVTELLDPASNNLSYNAKTYGMDNTIPELEK